MIIYVANENILDSPAQTLICPVNTMGVMGKGLALDMRHAYPGLYENYRQACRVDVFKHKGIFVWSQSENKKILCLPTKRHWKQDSKIEWIDKALEIVVRDYVDYGITSLAVPALGCGLGHLYWPDIHPLIQHYLNPLPITAYVYPPKDQYG